MAVEVHNPTRWDLFCHPLRRNIKPNETITVTDEEGATVVPGIFRVTGVDDAPEPDGSRTLQEDAAVGAPAIDLTPVMLGADSGPRTNVTPSADDATEA